MSPRSMLSLSGVRFGYDGLASPVLRDLSLEIPEAAVTAILGPNGSGKTTLLSLLLGMLSPQAGTILVDGKRQGDCSRRTIWGFVREHSTSVLHPRSNTERKYYGGFSS